MLRTLSTGSPKAGMIGSVRGSEQVGEPAPAMRRVKGDFDRLRLELAEYPLELCPIVAEAVD
jgi:hypothetical protein